MEGWGSCVVEVKDFLLLSGLKEGRAGGEEKQQQQKIRGGVGELLQTGQVVVILHGFLQVSRHRPIESVL